MDQVDEALQETEGERYAHLARTAYWNSKNAWVLGLQKELQLSGPIALPFGRTVRKAAP
jgi:hypothetical protein